MSQNESTNDIVFKRRETYFYKKSSIVPNIVIFNENLTDPAFRLLLTLNSFPDNWEIRRMDVMKRLNWGSDKMRNAVMCLEENGYMKVTQSKDKTGRYLPNFYEFDVEPVFLNNSTLENHQKCPHNDYEPRGGHPSTDTPYTVDPKTADPHISLFSEISVSLDEQQQQKEGDDPIVVVVPQDKISKIHSLLKPLNATFAIIEIALNLPLTQVEDAIKVYQQKLTEGELDNPMGFLRKAMQEGWKPNPPKIDWRLKKDERIELAETHKAAANQMATEFHEKKNDFPDKTIFTDFNSIIFQCYKSNKRLQIFFEDSEYKNKVITAKELFKSW